MDQHTAEVFTKDVLFDLTYTSVPFHLWGSTTIADLGVLPEIIPALSERLGVSQEGLTLNMTLQELAQRVEAESLMEVRIETELSPFFLI